MAGNVDKWRTSIQKDILALYEDKADFAELMIYLNGLAQDYEPKNPGLVCPTWLTLKVVWELGIESALKNWTDHLLQKARNNMAIVGNSNSELQVPNTNRLLYGFGSVGGLVGALVGFILHPSFGTLVGIFLGIFGGASLAKVIERYKSYSSSKKAKEIAFHYVGVSSNASDKHIETACKVKGMEISAESDDIKRRVQTETFLAHMMVINNARNNQSAV